MSHRIFWPISPNNYPEKVKSQRGSFYDSVHFECSTRMGGHRVAHASGSRVRVSQSLITGADSTLEAATAAYFTYVHPHQICDVDLTTLCTVSKIPWRQRGDPKSHYFFIPFD